MPVAARPLEVRSHLVRLVIVVLVPLAVLAAVLIVQLNHREHAAAETSLLTVARTLSESVDAEVNRTITTLQLLGRSESLAVRDFARFGEQLAAAREIHGRWSNALLLDEHGRRLVDLRHPVPDPALPPPVDDAWRRALQTLRPQVSNVFQPLDSPKPAVYMAVPLSVAGARYVVAASTEYDLWSALLSRQLPEGWIAAVDDRNGVIFARSERPDAFVGKPATRSIQELYDRQGEGTGRGDNREGLDIYLGFHTSPLTGWHTLVIVPAALLDAPAQQSLALLLAGTMFIFALALGLAFYAAHPLSAGIARLRYAVGELGRGRTAAFLPGSVREINEAGESVREASERLEAREAQVRELQARLAERAEAAEEASRMKDEFLGMLGHELRNPLAAIAGANAVLLMTLEGEARRMPRIVDRQARHLAALVDGLLDVSRGVAGKLEVHPGPGDLRAVVLDVHETLSASGALAGRNVTVDARPAPARIDPERMKQVVRNLLENALKHTPPAGRIAVSTRSADREAILSVEDAGAGIEPRLLPRIFEPFTQAPQSIDRRQGGLGLGLAIARQIVERHGGRIDAHSEGVGRGARFTVRLPLASSSAEGARAAPPPAQAVPLRVALVEDQEDVREGLAVMLRVDGHRVSEAGDAESGLALLGRQAADVAFIDIGLPGASGHEVARRARAAGIRCRLVALTGYGQDADRVRALEAGFDHFLAKPCTLEQIRELLATVTPRERRATAS